MQIKFIEKCRIAGLICGVLLVLPFLSYAQKRGVTLVKNEAEKRIDILINGEPFTAYRWAENLKKPVLYPLRTAAGTFVTRGFPLVPRGGESVDHPHQIGLWFDYGDVNGVDFWNNSTYRTPLEAAKMGTIVHRRIIKTKNGKTSGELQVRADWIMPDGKQILREETTFIFKFSENSRTIDRLTKLTALDKKVVFNDSKEGLFGLRVRRELEQPATQPILLTDASGKPAEKPILDNTNVAGEFFSSENKSGDDVWGTRGRWAALTGNVGREKITLVIFDHPQNVGFPTYWMTRGYGLFAANPLGQEAYSLEKKEKIVRELKFALEPKKSATFRFRVFIVSDSINTEQIETEYQNFIRQV